MPLQRRLPKRGFHSAKFADTAEVRLDELAKLEAAVIDLAVLKAANIVPMTVKRAKVILAGTLDKAVTVTLQGVALTKGARAALEAAGGSVQE